MAYKQREKKRKARMAEASRKRDRLAQRQGKKKSKAWWLTIVSRDTCCARCSGMLRIDRPMVFCASPQESLCQACAESAGIYARPSLRWVQSRRKR